MKQGFLKSPARWAVFGFFFAAVMLAGWKTLGPKPFPEENGIEESTVIVPQEQAAMNVLMIGNSHTGSVSQIVKKILQAETGDTVRLDTYFVGHLDQDVSQEEMHELVADPSNEIVILQAQKISSSHQIDYSTEAAERLGRAVVARGGRLFYFSEWKRKGVEETKYYEDIYQGIADRAGGEVIPVGRIFDAVLTKFPDLDLWMSDGNHANESGSEIAAIAIASWLIGEKVQSKSDLALPDQVRIEAQNAVQQTLKANSHS
ncbi:MAG: hypothetical protein KF812_01525 [Fimbriimonadaceae bacterium]|nr:hypothetical protein [Fimbriimonadaceae bacterium]